jgi:hypothetical protein
MLILLRSGASFLIMLLTKYVSLRRGIHAAYVVSTLPLVRLVGNRSPSFRAFCITTGRDRRKAADARNALAPSATRVLNLCKSSSDHSFEIGFTSETLIENDDQERLNIIASSLQSRAPLCHLSQRNLYNGTQFSQGRATLFGAFLCLLGNVSPSSWSPPFGKLRQVLLRQRKEEDIYGALGLPFIEPELREGRGEIERALRGKLPKLVGDRDLRGILHCHNNASDGTETLETMAKATRKRGFQYFGVADHSQSAHYAGGPSLEEIEAQHRQADRLNKSFGKEFRILKGIECDILADGSLDYPMKFFVGSTSS